MALDTEMLKARWGVTDPAQDPLVEMTAAAAQAMCENYCGRAFDLADDTQDFPGVARSVQLRRYPIVTVTALWQWQDGAVPADMTAGTPIATFQVDKVKGLLWPLVCPWGGILHVEWNGGYDTWPPDLLWAVTQAADILWSDTPGGGAAPGSAGGTGLGELRRLSVVGVYTADLSRDPTIGDGGDAWGVLPGEVVGMLDRYRAAAAIGVG